MSTNVPGSETQLFTPHFGAMKDEPKWPENWDQPWTDDEVDAFWDGR